MDGLLNRVIHSDESHEPEVASFDCSRARNLSSHASLAEISSSCSTFAISQRMLPGLDLEQLGAAADDATEVARDDAFDVLAQGAAEEWVLVGR